MQYLTVPSSPLLGNNKSVCKSNRFLLLVIKKQDKQDRGERYLF